MYVFSLFHIMFRFILFYLLYRSYQKIIYSDKWTKQSINYYWFSHTSSHTHLLEVDHLLHDVPDYRLGFSPVLHFVWHSQNVSSFPHKLLNVAVLALVCQLSQSHLLLRKLIIQIEQLQWWIVQLLQHWRENSWGQAQQWSLELRHYQSQWLMLDLHFPE